MEAGARRGIFLGLDAAVPDLLSPADVAVVLAETGRLLAGRLPAALLKFVAPVLRAGNSGSVYFTVNGKAYGPASPGNQVVKNLSLDVASLTKDFQPADPSADSDLAEYVAEATQAQN